MAEKMATVAWYGIALRVPRDWSLVGVSGDEKKGYFRVDSPIASAAEVRWTSAAGKPPDLTAKGREFLSGLEKSCKKKGIDFSSKIKQDRKDPDRVDFLWRADRLGQGRLVYCPDCDRVTIVQIVSARDENVSAVAPLMLDSLRDHRDDGLVDWALYDLEFAVPASYRLEKQKLLSGFVSLSFREKARTLTVDRWGLASTLLSKYEFEDWYRKEIARDIRGYRLDTQRGEVAGHDGLTTKGRRSGVKQAAKALFYKLTLYEYPGRYTGYTWHCDQSNRLFNVGAAHAEGDDIAEKVRDMILCHDRRHKE